MPITGLFPLVLAVMLCTSVVQAKIPTDVFKEVSHSVVVVRTYDTQGKDKMQGSGVIIKEDVVVTNCHVLKNATTIQVYRHEIKYPATLLQSDWDRDICSLAVNGLKGQAVTKGSSSRLQVGDKVYAVGAPQGFELTLSDGLISSLRPVAGGQYLQITAPISPGSSGGGLFDEEGRLIGLPTFYLTEGQQLNFAVPVDWIKELPKRNTPEPKTKQVISTDWLNKAIEIEQKKDWPDLLKHSLRWTKNQPGEGGAWFNLAKAYDNTNQPEKAIGAYQQVLRINPELAFAWTLLGLAYDKTNQPDKAIGAYQQVLRIKPEDVFAWTLLGVAYDKINKPDKAIEGYQQVLRLDPEDKFVWMFLGTAYQKTNQPIKAIEAYQHFTRINPDDADGWYALGAAYVKTNQTDETINAYRQCIRINPDNDVVWYNLGNVYGASNQPDKAIEAFQQVIRINPEHADAWYYLGVSYKITGQTRKVMEVYKNLKNVDLATADKFFNKFVMP